MKILALDIATVTGWATINASGTWNLKPKRGESDGMRVIRFASKLKEVIEAEDIELVSYERPAGRHAASIMVASELVGMMKAICVERDIDYVTYSAGEIKKKATGKGNAKKPQMIEAAKKEFDCEIIDDNHADALWLLKLTIDDLG